MPAEPKLTLKWGTLKSYNLSMVPGADELIRRHTELEQTKSPRDQHDTPEQREILCKLIDLAPCPIYLHWQGIYVSKEYAKEYVLGYCHNDTPPSHETPSALQGPHRRESPGSDPSKDHPTDPANEAGGVAGDGGLRPERTGDGDRGVPSPYSSHLSAPSCVRCHRPRTLLRGSVEPSDPRLRLCVDCLHSFAEALIPLGEPSTHRKQQISHLHQKAEGLRRALISIAEIVGLKETAPTNVIRAVKAMRDENRKLKVKSILLDE